MDGWWDEIERDIARWLECRGQTSVAELAQHLALSEEATASLVAVLVMGSPVRICRITAIAEPSPNIHRDVTVQQPADVKRRV